MNGETIDSDKRRLKWICILTIAFIPVYALHYYFIGYSSFSPYPVFGVLIWYVSLNLFLFISAVLLAKKVLIKFIPWPMLGINIFLFYSYLSFLNFFDVPGAYLVIKNVAATLILPMTYTFLIFFVLNLTSKPEEDIKSKKEWLWILLPIPYVLFFSSLVFMSMFLVSDFRYSDYVVTPLFFFVSSFLIMIFFEIIYFILDLQPIKFLSNSSKQGKKQKISPEGKKIIYIIIIISILLVGNMLFFLYHQEVKEKIPYIRLLGGELIYKEDKSTNTTVVFSIILYGPEKLNFEDVLIQIQNDKGDNLNFTYSFSDVDADGKLDTGDEISISLTDDEFSSGYRVFLYTNEHIGEIVYEF